MSKPVTCVVAEDEQLFRDALLALLRQEWPELEVVAVCDDGGAALEAIGEHRPDVTFLDIRMPGLTGLEVAAATAEISPSTQIVFVTAYDQYAIQAFERGAVDYLLKPIARDRLVGTIARLQGRVGFSSAHGATLAALIRELGATLPVAKPAEAPLVWLTASSGKETRLIMVDDVAYFRSDHKYTTVMTAQGEALLRTPLHELLAKLDPAHFKQIHRSTIVNMRMVASVVRDDSGRGMMRIKNRPETLPVSLTFMPLFRNM
ncbi:MAG: LytTR family DNA-binding domain-containing protein [Betaproteobacteria bacterium]